jgi:ABC-type transport system involved in cytochrome c biogenesis permease subunit
MVRFLFALFFSIVLAAPASAAPPSHDAFCRLPMQDGGRIKPVESFARAFLLNASGGESVGDFSACDWLVQTLFDPALAVQRPIFRVWQPSLLGLPVRKPALYSFADLAPVLQFRSQSIEKTLAQDSKDWSKDQADLIRLHQAVLTQAQLLRSFSLVLPLALDIPDSLKKEWKIADDASPSLDDLLRFQGILSERVKKITARHGADTAHYTAEEKRIVEFAFELETLAAAGQDNTVFRIIPGKDGAEGTWLSPWGLREAGEGTPENAAYLNAWADMARAYAAQDESAYARAAEENLRLSRGISNPHRLHAEFFYDRIDPLSLAMAFYLLSFFVCIAYRLRPFKFSGALTGLFSLALVFHAGAVAARIFILDRPPVGTLYESVIFVSLIIAMVAAAWESRRRDLTPLLLGAGAAAFLLFCARAFAASENKEVLVAVLNTPFWLATHVLCITIGYALCLLASLTAHIALWQKKLEAPKAIPVKFFALAALFFTAFGTILGGIWADQSWGRFWGWDPKENGALLIVLWIVWILHGQLSGHFRAHAANALYASLSIIVALAWFGVNLLNVGLHSYGFTQGVAGALGAFCFLQLCVIAFLYHRAARA